MAAELGKTIKIETEDETIHTEEVTMGQEEVEMKVEVHDEPLEVEYQPKSPGSSEDEDDGRDYHEMSSDSSDDYYGPPPGYICQPYMFEPKYTEAEMKVRDRKKAERTKLVPWCSCPYCTPSDLEKRKVCCNSGLVGKVRFQYPCITDYEEFKYCVTNKHQMKIYRYMLLRQQKKEVRDKLMVDSNALWRLLAYRQFTLWINSVAHTGGKQFSSVPIPSCVIRAVRREFPEESRAYSRLEIKLEGEDFQDEYPA